MAKAKRGEWRTPLCEMKCLEIMNMKLEKGGIVSGKLKEFLNSLRRQILNLNFE